MIQGFYGRLRSLLLADTPSLSVAERRRSTVGALLSVGLCSGLLHVLPGSAYWLLAPMGASTVILLALSHSPLAQPWPVIGSYLCATLAGLACALLIPQPQLAAAVAVAACVWFMARLNCIHPPAGALALLLVLDQKALTAALSHTLALVALNVALLLAAALLVNNLVLRRPYPYRPQPAARSRHGTQDAPPIQRSSLDHADLAHAVRTLDIFVDVREDELVELYNLAVEHAFGRHLGLTCGDIMSRDIVSAEFSTELEQAWQQLRQHKIKAMPVVDGFNHLIGIVTVADFLRQVDDTTAAGLAVSLQGLLRRTPGMTSEKAEVVGQIMSSEVHAVRADTPVADLVSHLSDKSLHHIPVLDDSRRVLGMVTQSDLIAALYKRVALASRGEPVIGA